MQGFFSDGRNFFCFFRGAPVWFLWLAGLENFSNSMLKNGIKHAEPYYHSLGGLLVLIRSCGVVLTNFWF